MKMDLKKIDYVNVIKKSREIIFNLIVLFIYIHVLITVLSSIKTLIIVNFGG